ncbi:hypothetical protein P873_11435 [Arenimonas composti TR7-09 = DSM 18010]|uniref:protein-glutamate methylesterase n=1 Tax=Arenimonas composti TR7-09 = DSM 18010 TaxID=1121013 RepID=A0A091BEK9_9GAMM|nr:hypothetical protein P873_11435 [Arenimonas composti TR7-09 = DSM 18010]
MRVALLARPGDARDQLRRALADAGAELVAEGDPAELDPGAVAGGQPGIVVVSLEPAIEEALERFDELLHADAIEVIYDDAEVTRQLDGWDLARWARHLAAKLTGATEVLPPAPEGQELHVPVAAPADADDAPALELPEVDPAAIQPGAPPTPAQEMDAEKLEDYAAESLELSDWVPSNPSLAAEPVEAPLAEANAAAGEEPSLELDLDLDLAGLEQALTAGADAAAPTLASALEASGIDVPQQLDADEVPLHLEDTAAGAPASAEAPTAEVPLGLEDADAPLELEAADAPLDFDGGDAPLDLEADDTPLDFDAGDVPLDFDPAGEAPLDLETSDEAPLDFASADEPMAFDGMEDTPLDFTADAAESEGPAADGDLDLDLDSGVDVPVAAGDDAPLPELEIGDGPVRFSTFTEDEQGAPAEPAMDDDVAALAAQLEAFEANDTREMPREPDFANIALDPSPTPAAAAGPGRGAPAAPAAPAAGGSLFDNLELVPMDADLGKVTAADANTPPAPSLAAVAEKRTVLNLAGENETRNVQAVSGALFVVAGLGGPDGVRQLLAALPPTLPVPVLLYQHLDTGKHERLVTQLSKASKLPLDLAVAGKMAFPGRVAVLQPGIGISVRGEHVEFTEGSEGLAAVVAALPAADSAVLVLSGADPAVMPAALALGAAGGLLLAQDPETCFDPVAPQAAIAAGGSTGAIAELARRIIERWS